MKTRRKQPVARYEANASYPALADHRPSRRTFLAVSGACVGAGAMATLSQGCVPPMGGTPAAPDYHRIRLPADPEDRAVYLVDGGYARFYVVALTYHEDCAVFAEDARETLTAHMVEEMGESTYDELSTQTGKSAVRERLRARLDEAYNEDTGDSATGWFQDVELYLNRLDAPAVIDGLVGGDPEYP